MSKYEGWTIISDYDGTLTNGRGYISKDDINAINYFVENGGNFSVATGRGKFEIDYLFEGKIKQNIPGIYYNGAIIQDSNTDEVLYSKKLQTNFKQIVCKCIADFPDLIIHVCSENKISVVQNAPFTKEMKLEFLHALNIFDETFIDDDNFKKIFDLKNSWYIYESIEDISELCYKILISGFKKDIEKAKEVLKEFDKEINYKMLSSLPINLEITSQEANKGTALNWLSKNKDIGNLFVLGDGENDIEMFGVAKYSATPAFANEKLKEISTIVCDRNQIIVPTVLNYIDKVDKND